jgi:hypothetical protein
MGMDNPVSNATPPQLPVVARIDPMPTSTGSGRRRRIFAHLLLIVILAPSAGWVVLDRSVWPFDQAWYGEVSVDLYAALGDGAKAWMDAMGTALPSKPPGIAWLGQWFVPVGLALGRIETALLASVLLCQFGTLVLVYRTGRLLAPDRPLIAMVGSLMVGASPLFVGMSHNYFAEPLQTFAVAWVFYITSRGPGASRVRLMAELIAVAAVGMLAKTTTPIYCLLAGLLCIVWMIRSRRPDVRRAWRSVVLDWGALVFSLALAACAVVWFWQNAESVLRHAKLSSMGDVALHYGSDRPFLEKLSFWCRGLQQCFLLEPMVWVLAAGAVLASVLYGARIRSGRPHRRGPIEFVALVALAQIVAVVCVFSLSINEETRYLLPLAVPIGIVLMWTLAQFPDWSLASVWCVLLGGQWACVFLQAFGGIAPQPTLTHWLVPVERDARRSQELARVVEATSNHRIRNRINVIGVEYPWFNANSASFYAAKAALAGVPRCRYTSLGYAEADAEAAWERLVTGINAPYFVTIAQDYQIAKDTFNSVSLPILQRALGDPAFNPVPFVSECGVLVFRRDEVAE